MGGCRVFYDYQRCGMDNSSDDGFGSNLYDDMATAPGPAWLRKWLGDDILANVVNVNITGKWRPGAGINATTERPEDLPAADQVRSLSEFPEERDLAPLAQLSGLEELVLASDIAPSDLQNLLELKNLKVLILHGLTSAAETDLPRVSSHSESSSD